MRQRKLPLWRALLPVQLGRIPKRQFCCRTANAAASLLLYEPLKHCATSSHSLRRWIICGRTFPVSISIRSIIAALATLTAVEAHAAVALVTDGKPMATIVITSPVEAAVPPAKGRKKQAATSENEEARAAKVLVDWIK